MHSEEYDYTVNK